MEIAIDQLDKDQRSCLLYLECRAVDYDGVIDDRLPGSYKWTQQGAIQFPKTETYQSKSEPGKDHNTHDPWQET